MQFQVDILGITVQRPMVTEMAALGACCLAGLEAGFRESREEIEQYWKIDRIFEPEIGEDEKKKRYDDWKRTMQRSLFLGIR